MTLAVFVCGVISGELPPSLDGDEFDLMVDSSHRRLSDTNSTGLEPGAVVAITAGSIAGAIALVGFLYWAWGWIKGGAQAAPVRPEGYVRPSGFAPPSGYAFGETVTEPATEMPLLRISMTTASAQQPRRH